MVRGSRPRRPFVLQPSMLLAGALALILQLVLAPAHMAGAPPAADSFAELAALTGQHAALCVADDGQQPGSPVHGDADCPGLCCQLGHGLAAFLPPPVLPGIVVGRSFEIHLPQAPSAPRGRSTLSAQPRGPPQTA
ncbi:hypothetical protein SAMN05444161_7932 [Rhizobiales bacterium GAS191]|nr:hypothetical protein SAMN05444161_7932 [Rhizobiales bacterium GAS191]